MKRSGLSIRTFQWDDIRAFVSLDRSIRLSKGEIAPTNPEIITEILGQPQINPEKNCFVLEINHEVVGYGILHHESPINRCVLELKVHPKYANTGAEQKLIENAIFESKILHAKVLHLQTGKTGYLTSLLKRMGFSPIRKYWLMQWKSTKLQEHYPPDGFFFRHLSESKDIDSLTLLQNKAFDGSWGFSPNTREEIQYRTRMSNTKPGGIIFMCSEQDVCGYCWTFIINNGKSWTGTIAMIGIDPNHRSKGLGKPLLLEGLKFLHSRGVKYVELEVDSQNQPAIRLYSSLGFKTIAERHWFEISF
ncbi:GNAT family N-acetyltransferase [SAR202 cluster bacterium AC-409-J13_OGT_754m]|nr:GNAT family N-acetyltransferase [SAR202 cluster bacterium AC-409-J13_OGT_754m]